MSEVAPALVELRWWHLEQVHGIELDLFDDAWSAEMLWSELAQPDRFYLAALVGDVVVGYAGLGGGSEPGDEATVVNIAVSASHQGTGLGRRLLAELLREAARRQAFPVILEVRVDNVPAKTLYTAAGFTVIGTRRGYYQPSGADATVMRLASPAAGLAALEARMAR